MKKYIIYFGSFTLALYASLAPIIWDRLILLSAWDTPAQMSCMFSSVLAIIVSSLCLIDKIDL